MRVAQEMLYASYSSRIAVGLALYYNGASAEDVRAYGIVSATHLNTLRRVHQLPTRHDFRKYPKSRAAALRKLGNMK